MPKNEEPVRLDNAGAFALYTPVPFEIALDPDLTKSDWRVYHALDILAGKRGWWYGEQSEIMILAAERIAKLGIDTTGFEDLTRVTINRAIRALKHKKIVITAGKTRWNLQTYYLLPRKPTLPPIHQRT